MDAGGGRDRWASGVGVVDATPGGGHRCPVDKT